MNIELIIFFVLWLVLTEVMFFRYIRYNLDSFIEAKLLAIFLGFILSFFLFGLPATVAVGVAEADAVGNIFYVWYYGVSLIITLFFGINYLVYKKSKKKWKKN